MHIHNKDLKKKNLESFSPSTCVWKYIVAPYIYPNFVFHHKEVIPEERDREIFRDLKRFIKA